MTWKPRSLLLTITLVLVLAGPALGAAKWQEMTITDVKKDLEELSTFCLLHNITLEDVLWANNCKEEDLVPGKLLYLPTSHAELLAIWQRQGAWQPKALVPTTSAAAAERAKGAATAKPAPAPAPKSTPVSIPKPTSEDIRKPFPASLLSFLSPAKKPTVVQSGKMLWPVNGAVSSGFGSRGKRRHDGIDIPMPAGTPIRVARDGVVAATGNNSPGFRGYGKFVLVDHGGGIKTLYAHCSKVNVKLGQRLRQGQVIAQVGRTGRASTNHVHFEVRLKDKPVNPIPYLQKAPAAAVKKK